MTDLTPREQQQLLDAEQIKATDPGRVHAVLVAVEKIVAARLQPLADRLGAITAYASHPGNWGASDSRGRLIRDLATGAIDPAGHDWADPNLPALPPSDEKALRIAELEAAVDNVRRLHSPDNGPLDPGLWCAADGQLNPCATMRALGAE